LTTHSNTPENGASFYYIQTFFYGAKGTDRNRCQIAYSYETHDIAYRFYRERWNEWTFITDRNYCKMSISGITTAHSTTEIIKHWGQPTSNGFIADTNNYRL